LAFSKNSFKGWSSKNEVAASPRTPAAGTWSPRHTPRAGKMLIDGDQDGMDEAPKIQRVKI